MHLHKTGKSYTIMGMKIDQYAPRLLTEDEMEAVARHMGVDTLDQDEEGIYCQGKRVSDAMVKDALGGMVRQ